METGTARNHIRHSRRRGYLFPLRFTGVPPVHQSADEACLTSGSGNTGGDGLARAARTRSTLRHFPEGRTDDAGIRLRFAWERIRHYGLRYSNRVAKVGGSAGHKNQGHRQPVKIAVVITAVSPLTAESCLLSETFCRLGA